MLVNYYYVYIYKDYKNQRGIHKARCVYVHNRTHKPSNTSNQR
jgi:hypothetical protein